MGWLSADSSSTLNTASFFHCQLWLMNSFAMFAQSRAHVNKPQRPMLALCCSMGCLHAVLRSAGENCAQTGP